MFSYHQPHSAYSYMQRRNESSNLLADAAQKGIALLNKQIDYQLLNAFQSYILSVLNLVSQKMGMDYISYYNQFNLSISHIPPYEQVKRTIEFLLNIAKNL